MAGQTLEEAEQLSGELCLACYTVPVLTVVSICGNWNSCVVDDSPLLCLDIHH